MIIIITVAVIIIFIVSIIIYFQIFTYDRKTPAEVIEKEQVNYCKYTVYVLLLCCVVFINSIGSRTVLLIN